MLFRSFPNPPPKGYEALPLYDPERAEGMEIGHLEPSSNSKADLVHIIPSSEESDPSDSSLLTHRPPFPWATLFGYIKMVVQLLLCGIPVALLFSFLFWAFGLFVLGVIFQYPRSGPSKNGGEFGALLAGAVVVAAALGTIASIVTIVRQILRPRKSQGQSYGGTAFGVILACIPCSMFSMPLGYAMMPWLETDPSFGPKDALLLGVVGFCAPSAVILFGSMLNYLFCQLDMKL